MIRDGFSYRKLLFQHSVKVLTNIGKTTTEKLIVSFPGRHFTVSKQMIKPLKYYIFIYIYIYIYIYISVQPCYVIGGFFQTGDRRSLILLIVYRFCELLIFFDQMSTGHKRINLLKMVNYLSDVN